MKELQIQNKIIETLAQEAIKSVKKSKLAFCKFLTANDTGLTGAHQSGIYIPKDSYQILFMEAGIKGQNKKKTAKISWQDGSSTESSFTYYGVRTRNEYRITRFGRGFEFLRSIYTGALFVLCQCDYDIYEAWVLNTDADINEFLNTFYITPSTTNRIIYYNKVDNSIELREFNSFISSLDEKNIDFPDSAIMAAAARKIEAKICKYPDETTTDPDDKLIHWLREEYLLFQAIERSRYQRIIKSGFPKISDFILTANTILNRRKSRAGKSLEHHLSAMFTANHLMFEEQVKTEGNKRPDFIFPSGHAYHDLSFNVENLVILAAKTTCKDRWRQILSEANRLRNGTKYLCTLQRGISPEQLSEMASEKVKLIVPKPYINEYPEKFRDSIWSLKTFIAFIKSKKYDNNYKNFYRLN